MRRDAAGAAEELAAMYAQWPFFRSTLDLIEMVLAKADARIAAHYEAVLVPAGASRARRGPPPHGCRRHRRPCCESPAATSCWTTIRCCADRSTSATPTSIPSTSCRWSCSTGSAQSGGDERLRNAFLVTVNGVAAGMRNTG